LEKTMTPEERIRQLMEENARLRSQLETTQAQSMYSGAMGSQYQQFQGEKDNSAMAEELRAYEDYQRNGYYGGPRLMPNRTPPKPSQYLRKEPGRRRSVGLD
jgi:hypothetical protein